MSGGRQTGGVVMNFATFRRQWTLAPFLDACAAAGMSRVSLWGDAVEALGLAETRARLRDTGLGVFGYNRAGPLLAADAAGRAALIARAKDEVRRAADLGADHVLAFTGGTPPGVLGLDDHRAHAAEALATLAAEARSAGIRLALEPLHPMLAGDRTVLTTLAEANALADDLGDNVGIVVDAHHVWWDPALRAGMAAAAGRILALHVNDWLVPLPHPLNGRGMMGDGIIDLAGLHALARAAGYVGPVEVEIFSDHWWSQPPEEVMTLALDRCRTILGVLP